MSRKSQLAATVILVAFAAVVTHAVQPITNIDPATVPVGTLAGQTPLNVTPPTPSISSISPSTVVFGSPEVTITINGSNFGHWGAFQQIYSIAFWTTNGNVQDTQHPPGTELQTTIISSNQLTAVIPPRLLQSPTSVHILVMNGDTFGMTDGYFGYPKSNLVTFTVTPGTAWYVNGVSGSNNNTCTSPTTACKTIGHAISLAHSGDSISVAAGTYHENLTIHFNLIVTGSGAGRTVVNGGGVGRVVTVSSGAAHVFLSKLTIRNGAAKYGGGIYNAGTLTINNIIVSANLANGEAPRGGGIANGGTLTINGSVIAGNKTRFGGFGGGIFSTGPATINQSIVSQNGGHSGGGISVSGSRLTINSSTLSANASVGGGAIYVFNGGAVAINRSTLAANRAFFGGGISNAGTMAIVNSTLSGNTALDSRGGAMGGAIYNVSGLALFNSTLSGNRAREGGGIFNGGRATLQNSIVANNSGTNCRGTITSRGYNLSSDGSCAFSNSGDLDNTDPKLGTLGYYGGPTQTIPLVSGSPATDAGNPNGCTDGLGHLLKTDQRGKPRHDPEDTRGCDIGAYERQSD